MKKHISIIILLILICVLSVSLISCSKETSADAPNNEVDSTIIYDQEIIDAKYLKEKVSEATSIYYKSSIDGKFGDENSLFEVSLLPSKYLEVEYIESNGCQYIDTGIKVSNSLSFNLKFSDLNSDANVGAVFGNNGNYFALSRSDKTALTWANSSSSAFIYKNFSPYKEYTIYCNKDTITINNKPTSTISVSNLVGDDNILLFASNGSYASCKIYYFKIIDGVEVLRNFVPCIDTESNKPGLYDLITKQFYSNAYGSNFSVPSHNVESINLPIEYTQIDYLAFSGNQYFDSNVVLDSAFTIEYSVSIDSTTSAYSLVCGCGDELWEGPIIMGYYNNRFYAGANEINILSSYTKGQYDTYKAIINDNTQSFYKNEELLSTSNNQIEYSTNSLYIGSYNFEDTITSNIHFRGNLYSFKIYSGETLIRDYIPAMRRSDSEAGLYDLVNKTFISNIGSVDIEYGSLINNYELPDGYKQLNYIDSNGLQWIDTNVKQGIDYSLSLTTSYTGKFLEYQDNSYLGGFNNGTQFGQKYGYLSVGTQSTLIPATIKQTIIQKIDFNLNKNILLIDTTPIGQSDILDGEILNASTNGYPLFTSLVNSIPTSNAIYRMYSCAMYADESNIPIRLLIPCEKIDDSIVGLYDIINNVFYSSTTSSFIVDSTNKEVTLPSEYKIIDYIELTGGQYIDTGCVFNDASSYPIYINAKVSMIESMNYNSCLAGCGDVVWYGPVMMNFYNNQLSWGTNGYFRVDAYIPNQIYNYSYIANLDGNQIFTEDGALMTTIKNDITYSPSTLVIGSFNTKGKIESCYFKGKIYGFKISIGATTLRDYIPAYRISDGEAGLYDLINDIFYTNQGTGDFLYDNTNFTLPTEYQELDYIESTGIQYIDTGIPVNMSNHYHFDYQITSTKNSNVWGAYNNLNGINTSITYAYGNAVRWTCSGDTNQIVNLYGTTGYDTDRHTIEIINGNVFGDEIYRGISSGHNETKKTSCNAYLFAINDSGEAPQSNALLIGRIYSYKVWDDNEKLIQNFIPCYRKLDNKVGFFDVVNNVFYTNRGAGEFNIGQNIISSELPKGYKKVEYIETTGNQIINTGVQDGTNITIDCHMATATAKPNYWYGSTQNSKSWMYNGIYFDHLEYNWTKFNNSSTDITMAQRIDGSKTIITINNATRIVQTGTETPIGNIYIFGCNNGARFYGEGLRCYYFRVYDNNTIIRNFVPCIREQDQVVGLFDTINKVFYTNIGTGKFSYNILNEDNLLDYKKIEYVESNGSQYINTGIQLKTGDIFKIKYEQTSGFIFGQNTQGIDGNPYIQCANNYGECVCHGGTVKHSIVNGEHTYLITDMPSSFVGYLGLFCTYYYYPLLYGTGKIYSFSFIRDNQIICNMIPIIKISTNEIGMYDTINGIFYPNQGTGTFLAGKDIEKDDIIDNSANSSTTSINNNFTYGNYVGHVYDEGVYITKPSEKQDGDIVYTCKICGKQIHKVIEASSYSVTFSLDDGIDYIKVFNGYDLSTFEISNIGYTKNAYTNNFSKTDGIVYFEIVLKDGYSLSKIKSSGIVCKNVEDNIYYVSNISSNSTLTITTKKKLNAH